MGQRDQYQSEGATPAPSTSQTGHIGQSAGRVEHRVCRPRVQIRLGRLCVTIAASLGI